MSHFLHHLTLLCTTLALSGASPKLLNVNYLCLHCTTSPLIYKTVCGVDKIVRKNTKIISYTTCNRENGLKWCKLKPTAPVSLTVIKNYSLAPLDERSGASSGAKSGQVSKRHAPRSK